MEEKSIEELIYDETSKRLEEMESPGYEFPKRIGKGDVIGIISGIILSIVLIVCCTTGVIS